MANEKNSSRRAFVFGNAAIDEVFRVRALPETGASVLGKVGTIGLGGKGANQAIALSRTGMPTTFLAATGADQYGHAIREALSREPLEAELIERAEIPTDRSVVVTEENGDNIIITTNDCAASISLTECLSVLAIAAPKDAVLLQSNLQFDVTAELCQQARERDLFLVLNPSPFDTRFHELLPFADALFVNETEAFGLTELNDHEAVVSLRNAGATQVVMTLGSEGALLGTEDKVSHIPAVPANSVDVTGAGDCFEGVAVGSGLMRVGHIDEAAIGHASAAAAMTIEKHGAVGAMPSAGKIAELLE